MRSRGQWGWVVVVGLLLLLAGPVHAEGTMAFSLEETEDRAESPPETSAAGAPEGEPRESIDQALGELRWGMSSADLFRVLKARVRTEFEARIRAERDILRQDALYQKARQRIDRIKRGYVEFDGRKTGWDASELAAEFRHGSDEAMLVVDTPKGRDHYFFVGDRLWKWYRELRRSAIGADHAALADQLVARFGDARADRRETKVGQGYPGLAWSDERTRLTVFRRGTDSCVVFEDRAVLDELARLRRSALPERDPVSRPVDTVVMSSAEREAWRARQNASTTKSLGR